MHKLVRALLFPGMFIEHPPDLVLHLSLVLHAGKEDPDALTIILEIGRLIVQEENDLAFIAKDMLFAFAPHVPPALLFCRSTEFCIKPEDSHTVVLLPDLILHAI
jgi:hypothetical protein